MGTWHLVRQGEWVSKIAAHYRISDWEAKIWRHPNNRGLASRRDPNVLHPGDRLFIPAPIPKQVSRSTDQTHKFVMKTGYDEFHVRVLDSEGKPISDAPYLLIIGWQRFEGRTDRNGQIDHTRIIRTEHHEGVLSLPKQGLECEIRVGGLNPTKKTDSSEHSRYDDGISGLLMRLRNLGFGPKTIDESTTDESDVTPEGRNAIVAFQNIEMKRVGEALTGKLDDETRAAIIDKYGS